jgi:alginate O-acetyltransferase complex protein AlgI
MIFNSIDFLLFFPVIYLFYILTEKRLQNIILLIGSYFFYGYWDYRYLSLLFVSTIIDYFVSLGLVRYKDSPKKKYLLYISLFSNLGILGFFKYFNFFIISAKETFLQFGIQLNTTTLEFLLPLGISFYTFQTMSYTIDVYRGKLEPSRNFLDFALFVSFFPQLVAGPIERATHLLPQISSKRIITREMVERGIFLILLGFYKKVYIADNLSIIVDPLYSDPNTSGAMMIFANFVFYFQIYGDFSGYSDIARGLSLLMGFDLMMNFNLPYFSHNISEFWRRWHISFMSWLRDYVYFSLGGKDIPEYRKNINNLIVFFLSGLWHGANWTFVIWGSICGFINLGYKLISPYLTYKIPENKIAKFIYLNIAFIITTFFISFPLIYFRSESVGLAWIHTKNIVLNWGSLDIKQFIVYIKTIIVLLIYESYQYKSNNEFIIFELSLPIRVIFYTLFILSILVLGNFNNNAFIYFVF